MTTLAERVQAALDARGMNGLDLEVAGKFGTGYVSRVLRGERKYLRPEQIERFAKALRVSHVWLATGDGPMEARLAEASERTTELVARYDACTAAQLALVDAGHERVDVLRWTARAGANLQSTEGHSEVEWKAAIIEAMRAEKREAQGGLAAPRTGGVVYVPSDEDVPPGLASLKKKRKR